MNDESTEHDDASDQSAKERRIEYFVPAFLPAEVATQVIHEALGVPPFTLVVGYEPAEAFIAIAYRDEKSIGQWHASQPVSPAQADEIVAARGLRSHRFILKTVDEIRRQGMGRLQ